MNELPRITVTIEVHFMSDEYKARLAEADKHALRIDQDHERWEAEQRDEAKAALEQADTLPPPPTDPQD
jgi:hypothetical protein